MNLYDVAIIGGGPIGSRVAYRLTGMGRKVIVLEKKADLNGPVCCTGIISLECVSRFAIDRNVIVREENSARVFSPSGKLLSLKKQEPQACIVDRTAFNLSVVKLARENGAEYLFGSAVRNIGVQKDHVNLELETPGQTIEARAVVIAAGSASKLVEQSGFSRVGDFAMGAQAVVETRDVDEVEIYLGKKIAPAGFAWLVPATPGKALAGLLTREKTAFFQKSFLSYLAGRGKIVSADVESSFAQVPLKPLSRTYADRVLVVGSAAGQVKPTTGGGIYYGLICADIAADCLLQALERDNLTAKYLSEYEKRWKKNLGAEISGGYRARKLFELLSDGQIDKMFDIIISNGIAEAVLDSKDMSFDWHSGLVLKLIGHRALSGTFGKLRLPGLSRKKPGEADDTEEDT